MSALNCPDNFAGRVAYAAATIIAGREATRSFDNCFENYDGAYVSAALIRRAAKNPRLAANLPRYLEPKAAQACADRFAGQNLAKAAREHYAKRAAEDAARWAEMRAEAEAVRAAKAEGRA